MGCFILEEILRAEHNAIIESRKKFTLTGVKDVLSFEEDTITLHTALGKLVIKGSALRIAQFDNQSGDLTGEGRIHALIYTADEKEQGFISRLFK